VIAELPHRVGLQVVDAAVARRLAGHEPGGLEHPQVHGDGGPADRHARGYAADIERAGGQPPHNPAPHGVPEGIQRRIYVNGH
jgi:hypothetical protein